MRVVFVAALVLLFAWLLAWQETPPPPPPPSSAAVHRERKDCRDLCEQTAIVEQLAEAQMKACRARCERQTPLPPREPIRRITVAPADHSRTIRDVK